MNNSSELTHTIMAKRTLQEMCDAIKEVDSKVAAQAYIVANESFFWIRPDTEQEIKHFMSESARIAMEDHHRDTSKKNTAIVKAKLIDFLLITYCNDNGGVEAIKMYEETGYVPPYQECKEGEE